MQLFERVRVIANELASSQTKLALALGFKQETFCGYLKETRQDNLWPILPRILEIYPQIRREWLYFNEGPMIGENHKSIGSQPDLAALQAENVRLRAELDETHRLNRKLTLRLLGEEETKS